MQVLRGAHVQVEQPAQRQVDRGDLVEVDVVVDAAQAGEIGRPQRHRGRRAEFRPLVTPEVEVPTDRGPAQGVGRTRHVGLGHLATLDARVAARTKDDEARPPQPASS